ncbi:hypothetical protein KAR91_45725 [Candidatus Pacearchaeota archaeon]|nr:hypothetical protein [Candidatus Pacearchaeota archaeon]
MKIKSIIFEHEKGVSCVSAKDLCELEEYFNEALEDYKEIFTARFENGYGRLGVTKNFKNVVSKEIETMLQLLRELYDVVEMTHLTDNTMISNHVFKHKLEMTKSLSSRLFGYLQSKDQKFRDTVIRRQNKWRKHNG